MEINKNDLFDIKGLNKKEYEYLCDELLLNDLEKQILLMKIKEETIVKISIETGVGTTKVSTTWKKIKNKIKKIV